VVLVASARVWGRALMTKDPTASSMNVLAAPMIALFAGLAAVVGLAHAAGGIGVIILRSWRRPMRWPTFVALGPIYGCLAGVAVLSAANFGAGPKVQTLHTLWPLSAGAVAVPVIGLLLLLLCRSCGPKPANRASSD
jgi:hypothetical protein